MIRRGDIIVAKYGRQGTMPVVNLTEGLYAQGSGTIIAIALSRTKPDSGYPLSVPLTIKVQEEDLYARPGHIKTLSTEKLGPVIGHVPAVDLAHILSALNEIISE